MPFLCPTCGKFVEEHTKQCPHCSAEITRRMKTIDPCKDCGKWPELYQVTDVLWEMAGLNTQDTCCLKCLSDRVSCRVSIADMEPFPWYGSSNTFERGILDALEGKDTGEGRQPGATRQERVYRDGHSTGAKLRDRSDPDSIRWFVEKNSARVRGAQQPPR